MGMSWRLFRLGYDATDLQAQRMGRVSLIDGNFHQAHAVFIPKSLCQCRLAISFPAAQFLPRYLQYCVPSEPGCPHPCYAIAVMIDVDNTQAICTAQLHLQRIRFGQFVYGKLPGGDPRRSAHALSAALA